MSMLGSHSHSEEKCFIHSTCHIAWHMVALEKLYKVSTTEKCLVHQRRDLKGILRNSRRMFMILLTLSVIPPWSPDHPSPWQTRDPSWVWMEGCRHSPSLDKQFKGQALAKRTLYQGHSRLIYFHSRQTLPSINSQRPNQLCNRSRCFTSCVACMCWTSNHDSKANQDDPPPTCTLADTMWKRGTSGHFPVKTNWGMRQSPAASKFSAPPIFSIIINYLKLPAKSGLGGKKAQDILQKYKQNPSL